jgi:hypothetical protein
MRKRQQNRALLEAALDFGKQAARNSEVQKCRVLRYGLGCFKAGYTCDTAAFSYW